MGHEQSLTLTITEQTELEQHEITIERGLHTFVEVGLALMAIRDKKLYRARYGTFESYCQQRWNITPQHGRRLIAAAEVVNNLEPIGSKLPSSESQARSLAQLDEPAQQKEAWQRAVETAPEGKVTAAHVQSVVDEIKRPEPPIPMPEPFPIPDRMSIHYSSETPEHYTPRAIIDATIACLGAIDLDPCSNSHTSPNVPARAHYTQEDDGLIRPWRGRIYMNPPYGREIGQWVHKLISEHKAGHAFEAIALVPSRTDTQWWVMLRDYPVCFIEGRLTFGGNDDPAPFPSAVFYLGNDIDHFYYAFAHLGDIWQRLEPGMFGQ